MNAFYVREALAALGILLLFALAFSTCAYWLCYG